MARKIADRSGAAKTPSRTRKATGTATAKRSSRAREATATATATRSGKGNLPAADPSFGARPASPGASSAAEGDDFASRVRAVVRACPRGKVVSYGGVAALVGQPRAARAVGRALCTLEDGSDVPWWRVVNRNGEISIKCSDHGPQLQRTLLEREGVRFEKDRISWQRFGWDGAGAGSTDGDARAIDAADHSGISRKRRRAR